MIIYKFHIQLEFGLPNLKISKGGHVEMKGLILAAGRGSRMGKSTENLPKCMTTLWSVPLVQYQLNALRGAGVKPIAMVSGYRKDCLPNNDIIQYHNDVWENTNMVYSLMCAQQFLENSECIISYSDIAYSENAINKIIDSKYDIAILYSTKWLDIWKLRFDNPLSDAETLKICDNGRLLEIGKKTSQYEDIQGQYTGIIRFTARGFQLFQDTYNSLPENRKRSIDMTSMFSEMITNGVPVFGVPYDGFWLEVDNENDKEVYELQGQKYFE